MATKDIRFGSDVIKLLINGVNTLANAVGSTLGPGGRNVIYKYKDWPYVTKDGVTVARNIELENEFENMGAQMVKSVANRTCKDAGDGTTTATILAQAILNEGFKHIERGVNPIDIQRGINKATQVIIDYISNNIRQNIADNPSRIKNIATVSANWDNEIGTFIGDAVTKVGLDGAVHIKEGKSSESILELTEGVNFDRGFDGTSPYFITDQVKRNTEMDKPYILLYKGEMNSFRNLIPLLEQSMKNNAEVVIVAHSYAPDVLSSLVANKQSGKIKVAAIKAPYFGDRRHDAMNDLALTFNTTYFDESFGDKTLAQLSLNELGRCDKAIINATSCSFLGSGAERAVIDEHIENLKKLKEDRTLSEERIKNIDDRIAKLSGYIATLYIGASSEIELEEKYDRAEDALLAARAAIADGIVPGGSYSYIKALKCKEFIKLCNSNILGDNIGANIIKIALMAPFKKLFFNMGNIDNAASAINKIQNAPLNNIGFNIKSGKFENLLDTGVVDPFKVTRSALQNAASVAGLMLTSNVVIGNLCDKNDNSDKTSMPPQLF
jgi:chaperonin GroEL